ncbi:nucleoside hydrolase [Vibrio nomapromontoriensis]|uniref:nucleoside hydrolase n=1 Tax=Vibrio nomapromontoriensis TaxID=2910246 RepID=UPI003D0CFF0D
MNVLIDTDVDFDDYMAMLYLLHHPDISVAGISITGTGDVHLTRGIDNVKNMLTLTGNPEHLTIPVCRGFNAPLRYSNTFPGEEREAADNHYDSPFPSSNPNKSVYEAIEFLTDFMLETQEPVTLLCIGGGTTWGHMFEKAKSNAALADALKTKLTRIVMMGGNLTDEFVEPGATGNIQPTLGEHPCYSNKVAEWNIFIDPLGAQIIFESDIEIVLVALNATQQIPITQSFVNALASIKNPSAQFLTSVLSSPTIQPGIGHYLDFWDPLAASVITNPELIHSRTFPIRVEQSLNEENDNSGQILVDHDQGSPVKVALSANAILTYENYLKIISRDTITI